MNFYVRSLVWLQRKGVLHRDDSVLVVAGGTFDRACLLAAGLSKVLISNLEYHAGETVYEPFQWIRLDAERIEMEDASFDWVIVHAGLHHLGVPAAGVCEMFRVARKGIICFEARDSWAMRVASRIGLTSEYELEAALLTDGKTGGYRNGPIPNYVYRWTEREFEKVILSYDPAYKVDFFFRYGFQVPLQRFEMARSALFRLTGRFLARISGLLERVMLRQGNQFAMVAVKTGVPQPWLDFEAGNLRFRADFVSAKYNRDRYIRR